MSDMLTAHLVVYCIIGSIFVAAYLLSRYDERREHDKASVVANGDGTYKVFCSCGSWARSRVSIGACFEAHDDHRQEKAHRVAS